MQGYSADRTLEVQTPISVLRQAFLDQRGEDFAPDSERIVLVRPLLTLERH